MAIGTGRTLKAAIEQLPPMDCPQHKVVSLTGNISPDGSAAFYNVIFTMADRIKARSFPMPLPVIASSPEEREMLLSQPMIQPTLALAAAGRRHLRRHRRPRPEGAALRGRLHHRGRTEGAAEGRRGRRDRRLGVRPRRPADRGHHQRPRRLGAAAVARALAGHRAGHGRKKLPGILAAVTRRLVNGLITDERTAAGFWRQGEPNQTFRGLALELCRRSIS